MVPLSFLAQLWTINSVKQLEESFHFATWGQGLNNRSQTTSTHSIGSSFESLKSDSFEHRKQTRESSLYPDIGTRSVGIRGMEGHSTPETRTTTKGGKLHRQSSGQTYPGSKYRIQLSSTDFARETSAARSDVLNYWTEKWSYSSLDFHPPG